MRPLKTQWPHRFFSAPIVNTANRLISVGDGTLTTQYQYNGDGDRTRRWLNGTETRYALDPVGLTDILAETTGSQTTRYLPGLTQVSGSSRQYFLPDRLGSVRLVMPSATGEEPALLRNYDPFGKLSAQSGTGSTFGYTGEPLEPLGGLVYLRARYYQPGTGRFLTPDPFPGMLEIPYSLHAYQYAYGNPVLYTDPSGKFIPATMVAGAFIGAGVGVGAYALSAGDQFNTHDAFIVGATGAAAGFAIGSGAALLGAGVTGGAALMGGGVGAAASGGGYLAANAFTGSNFCAGDFLIYTGFGAIGGAVSPYLPGPWSITAWGGAVNAYQYMAVELYNGRRPTPDGVFWNWAFGAGAGLASTVIIPPSSRIMSSGLIDRYGIPVGISTKEAVKDYARVLLRFSVTENFPRSFLLSLYTNVPGIAGVQ